MLVLFVLLVRVPPIPVSPLLIVLQVFVVDVSLVPAIQPVPVRAIFMAIPVVIILVVRIVDPAIFALLALMFFVILCDDGSGVHQRYSESRR